MATMVNLPEKKSPPTGWAAKRIGLICSNMVLSHSLPDSHISLSELARNGF